MSITPSPQVPQPVKDRAEVVWMNARGDYVETLAVAFNGHVETVRIRSNVGKQAV